MYETASPDEVRQWLDGVTPDGLTLTVDDSGATQGIPPVPTYVAIWTDSGGRNVSWGMFAAPDTDQLDSKTQAYIGAQMREAMVDA